jgi:hypothetical protein
MAPHSDESPHTTNVSAWEVPSAIAIGERFRIRVGIKCSHACDQTNRDFAIHDHEGALVFEGKWPGECWPDTTGLYVAEVELEAPPAEGLYTWTVNSRKSDAGIPHDEGAASFGVRVVRSPECVVTIEAFDKVTQTPLSGARVVMHPYRAIADERGIAELRVAKGTYTLFVSQNGYLTFGLPVEATRDIAARAELELEPVLERN